MPEPMQAEATLRSWPAVLQEPVSSAEQKPETV